MNRTALSDASSLAAAVPRLARTSVLVVGDVMLDRYVYGRVERISPEAPVPILAVEREVAMPGGAGNVVRNLTALGAAVAFISVVGDDQTGSDLTGLVGGQPGVEPWLLVQGGRTTTQKTRYVADGQHLLRADQEVAKPIHPKLGERLLRITRDALAATSICVLSDYGKGLLSDEIPARIIADAKMAGRRVIVSPKGVNWGVYSGADLIVPTGRDLAQAVGMEVESPDDVIAAARLAQERFGIAAVLATQAPDGMTFVTANEVWRYPIEAAGAVDMSGATDTIVAALAAALAAKLELPVACQVAGIAAGVVLGKPGTAVAREADLLAALSPGHHAMWKVMEHDAAAERVERWRRRGWRTGFIGGAFDAERAEDVARIAQARGHCDRLVVGLLREQGKAGVDARASLIAGLPDVDLVVDVAGDGTEAVLRQLRPEVVVCDGREADDTVMVVRGWNGTVVPAGRDLAEITTV